MIKPTEEWSPISPRIGVVQNWLGELKRVVPTNCCGVEQQVKAGIVAD